MWQNTQGYIRLVTHIGFVERVDQIVQTYEWYMFIGSISCRTRGSTMNRGHSMQEEIELPHSKL